MTHDYKRNGTTTLFAALSVLDGSVVGQCLPRHRHQEFLKFLRTLDREFPGELELHLIVDNYRTHKHANVKAWLAAPAVPSPLHPDLELLAQPRRALVPRADRQSDPPRRLPQRPRTDRRDRTLPRRPQRRPQTIPLDRLSRRDPRQGRTL